MCKYLYHGDKCCSPAVNSDECVGVERCHLFSNTKENELADCTFEAWYGVYCPKYKRFFCPGKGQCDTFEQYMKNFAANGRDSHP